MNENNLETWVIKMDKYKKMNKIVIPTSIDVICKLGTEYFKYAKFNIKEVDYDNPKII